MSSLAGRQKGEHLLTGKHLEARGAESLQGRKQKAYKEKAREQS